MTVTDASGVYSGSGFRAKAYVAGVNGQPGTSLEGVGLTLTYFRVNANASLTQLSGAPVNVGSYKVMATFAGSADYQPASASALFTITYDIEDLSHLMKPREAGSTIEFVIEVATAGDVNISSPNIVVTAVGMASTSSPGVLIPVHAPGNSDPANVFRFEGDRADEHDRDDRDNGRYEFDLKTSKGLASGTYLLYFTVQGDPLVHSLLFQIKN